jgi:hypothetical protein
LYLNPGLQNESNVSGMGERDGAEIVGEEVDSAAVAV